MDYILIKNSRGVKQKLFLKDLYMKYKDLCYTIGIIIAIVLALYALLRPNYEGLQLKNDNSAPWIIDMDEDTNKLQFIYQGDKTGDGKRTVVMNLTKEGNMTVHRGISFEKPIDQSWQISPDKNNSLTFANKAGGGLKLDANGSVMPIKFAQGGPIDFSSLCMQNDGTGKIYSGSCQI